MARAPHAVLPCAPAACARRLRRASNAARDDVIPCNLLPFEFCSGWACGGPAMSVASVPLARLSDHLEPSQSTAAAAAASSHPRPLAGPPAVHGVDLHRHGQTRCAHWCDQPERTVGYVLSYVTRQAFRPGRTCYSRPVLWEVHQAHMMMSRAPRACSSQYQDIDNSTPTPQVIRLRHMPRRVRGIP